MKRSTLSVAALALAATLSVQSCIGSFGLFNSLLSWNKRVSNKFVNELLYIVLSPAYVIAGVADILVLNTIEFWSGHNPVAANVGKTQTVLGSDGRLYAVKTLKDGYDITTPDGETVSFVYNKRHNSWSIRENGECRELFRYNADGTVRATLPDGQALTVPQTEQGLYELRMAAGGGTYFALH